MITDLHRPICTAAGVHLGSAWTTQSHHCNGARASSCGRWWLPFRGTDAKSGTAAHQRGLQHVLGGGIGTLGMRGTGGHQPQVGTEGEASNMFMDSAQENTGTSGGPQDCRPSAAGRSGSRNAKSSTSKEWRRSTIWMENHPRKCKGWRQMDRSRQAGMGPSMHDTVHGLGNATPWVIVQRYYA